MDTELSALAVARGGGSNPERTEVTLIQSEFTGYDSGDEDRRSENEGGSGGALEIQRDGGEGSFVDDYFLGGGDRSALPSSGRRRKKYSRRCIARIALVEKHVAWILAGLTLVLQVAYAAVEPSGFGSGAVINLPISRITLAVLMGIAQTLQLMALIFMFAMVATNVARWNTVEVWMLYLTCILGFQGIYRYVGALFDDSFTFPPGWRVGGPGGVIHGRNDSVPLGDTVSSMVLFTYFSIATQTTVGYGDVAPVKTLPRFLANLQMIIGLAFGSMIVGLTLESTQQRRQRNQAFASSRKKTCWRKIKSHPAVVSFRRVLRQYLLLITFAMSFLNTLVVYIVNENILAEEATHGKGKRNDHDLNVAFVSVLFLILQGSFVLVTSFKYVRGASTVTLYFLMQVFFSTCVVFAGIYTTISIYQKRAFVDTQRDNLYNQSFWMISYEFLYFSITTMTTTGYGTLSPRTSIAQFFCSLEMIVSQIFTQIILSIGLQGVATQLERAGKLARGSFSLDNGNDESDRDQLSRPLMG